MKGLKTSVQAEPVSVAVKVEMNGDDLGQRVRTFSVRSINECLLGYVANVWNQIVLSGYDDKLLAGAIVTGGAANL